MRRKEDLNPLNLSGPSEAETAELNSGNFRDSQFGRLVKSGIFRGGAAILGAGAAIGGAQLLHEALQNTPAPVHGGISVAHAEERDPLPTKSPHTATPVPSDTPEATATNEPQPTPRDHTPTPVGETPTVSPTPPPSETPPPTPSATATKEAPSPTATETEVPPSATATEKPATATATPPASPTPEEEEGQVQLLVKKRIDDGDGIFDDGDEPWIQRFDAWVDTDKDREQDSGEQSQSGQTDNSGMAVVTFEGPDLGPGTLLCAKETDLSDNLVAVTGKNCDLVDDSGSAEARLLNANIEGHAQPTPPQPTIEAVTPTVPVPLPVPSEMPRAGTGGYLDSTGEKVFTATTIAGVVSGLLGLAFLKGSSSLKRAESIVRYRLRKK